MRSVSILLAAAALSQVMAGLYDGNNDVVVLTDKDFNKKGMNYQCGGSSKFRVNVQALCMGAQILDFLSA
jgi:hypothetical protein